MRLSLTAQRLRSIPVSFHNCHSASALRLNFCTARRRNNLSTVVSFAAQVGGGATILIGVAGAFDNGGAAAGLITHPRYGLALYVRGRTGDNFRGAVAGNGATVEVAFAGDGFHDATVAIRHSPDSVR